MRYSLLFLAGVLALACVGCSPWAIANDYDTTVDFRDFKTFDWLDNRPGIREAVGAQMEEHRLYDVHLRTVVDRELDDKGLEKDEVDPDLLVFYHVGKGDDIDVTLWGYRYGVSYFGGKSRAIDVYAYHEGTLILDLIDAKTMDLVWRGSAQNTIDEKPIPGEFEGKIGEAVPRILAYYPPF